MREYIPKIKYIRPEVWKRITSVIKDYNNLKAEYSLLINNENAEVIKNEIERKLTAVDNAMNSFDAEVQELIKQRYWKGRIYRDVMLPLSESTMKRYVRRFVITVGRNLGELK
jgi:hypothetical protein|nr:MAG TPA: Protein of unknown function (DUF722) [Caudoviricetes sp.]